MRKNWAQGRKGRTQGRTHGEYAYNAEKRAKTCSLDGIVTGRDIAFLTQPIIAGVPDLNDSGDKEKNI